MIWFSAKAKGLKNVLKIPGEHNISNASAVLELAKLLEIKNEVALKALGSFAGSWRRFEYKGIFNDSRFKIQVFDDYAHHPTEIKVTLSGFRDKFPGQPIICVYQPHQAKRLQALFREFVSAFELADVLILLPVYEVAGRDKVNSNFTSEKLVRAIKKKYLKKNIYYLEDPKKIKKFVSGILHELSPSLRQSPVLVMMGAGTVVEYTPLLLKK